MKTRLLIFLVYTTSFSLYACNKPDKLKTTQEQASDILKQLDRQHKEEIEKPHSWPITKEDLTELYTTRGAHNNCFSCNYQWNENTDPNLY